VVAVGELSELSELGIVFTAPAPHSDHKSSAPTP
jgi:hypothetical protein